MLEAVIYDMDGLIIDSEPLWREAEIAIFQSIGVPMTEEMCLQVKGIRIDEVIAYWYNIYQWTEKTLKEVEDLIISKMISLIKEKSKLLDGVTESLKLFQKLGLKIALASSSSSKLIDTVLDTLGLHLYFEVIQSAENEEFGKPHPSVFITTAQKLNVPPTNCLVLEDSLNGVIAALAAKMHVIAIPEKVDLNNDRFRVAHFTFNSLRKIDESVVKSIS